MERLLQECREEGHIKRLMLYEYLTTCCTEMQIIRLGRSCARPDFSVSYCVGIAWIFPVYSRLVGLSCTWLL